MTLRFWGILVDEYHQRFPDGVSSHVIGWEGDV